LSQSRGGKVQVVLCGFATSSGTRAAHRQRGASRQGRMAGPAGAL